MNRFRLLLCVPVLLLFSVAGNAQAPVTQAPARTSLADVSERLARLEQQLSSGGLLDMLEQLQALQRDLNQLRGEIEVQNRNIEDLTRRQRALYTDIDQRLQAIQGGGAAVTRIPGPATDEPPLQTLGPTFESSQPAAVSAGAALSEPDLQGQAVDGTAALVSEPDLQDSGAPAVPGVAVQTAPSDLDPVQVQAEYQHAFDLLKDSRYEEAIQAFQAFLGKYPISDYSDNAQYWLGEAFYVMRRFEQALEEYNKLVTNYPQSQKYTHALLKIGYSYHELGLIEDARKYLQSLIREYPGTTASRLAEERLKSIALAEQQNTGTVN